MQPASPQGGVNNDITDVLAKAEHENKESKLADQSGLQGFCPGRRFTLTSAGDGQGTLSHAGSFVEVRVGSCCSYGAKLAHEVALRSLLTILGGWTRVGTVDVHDYKDTEVTLLIQMFLDLCIYSTNTSLLFLADLMIVDQVSESASSYPHFIGLFYFSDNRAPSSRGSFQSLPDTSKVPS